MKIIFKKTFKHSFNQQILFFLFLSLSLSLCFFIMIPIYSWYTKYIKYTIKTIFIPIPSSFINYLNSDGIVLPKNSNVQMLNGRDELSDDEDLNPIQNSLVSIPPNFDELTSLLDNAIQEYNGKVFIKLHTKAPIDSAWINGGTLACHTSGDIYMLLKSSIKVLFIHLFSFVNFIILLFNR